MAGNLMRHARAAWLPWSLLATALPAPATPPLADPTRPPVLAAAAKPSAPRAVAATPAAAPASAAEAPPPLPTPVLQSVHLPAQGLPSALVDGKLLQPGDRLAGPWGERHVQAIDAQGLLLAQPGRAPLRLPLWAAPASAPSPAATAATASPSPDAATVATRSKP